MDNLIPITLRCRFNGITLEVCHGKISDIFRQLRYGPVVEFELPDTKVTEEEFQHWLRLYRDAPSCFERKLLEEVQCN